MIRKDQGNEIVLDPGVVVEVQAYDDDQIAQWDADDNLQERGAQAHTRCRDHVEVRLLLDANVNSLLDRAMAT